MRYHPRSRSRKEEAVLIYPYVELRHASDVVGNGVFATRFIPKGTITWVHDRFDQRFSPAEVSALVGVHQKVIHKYGYRDGRGDTILCWDHARFINHSCAATCLSPGFDFEIAVRDIPAGAELTDDYRTLGLEEEFHCSCGAQGCVGVVRPEDAERETDKWDASVAAVFPLLHSVEQPLWDLVREKEAVEDVLAGRRELPSWRVHSIQFNLGLRRVP
jgi:hypothetical protein